MTMPKRTLSFDDVEAAGRAWPDVEVSTVYGSPALKVRERMFACIAIHRSAEPDTLAVRMSFTDRDRLIASQPRTYYLTDHYVDYPCVLVRLGRIGPRTLRGLLRKGWRFVADPSNSVGPRSRTKRNSSGRPTRVRR
jgi:hypothetical protein